MRGHLVKWRIGGCERDGHPNLNVESLMGYYLLMIVHAEAHGETKQIRKRLNGTV